MRHSFCWIEKLLFISAILPVITVLSGGRTWHAVAPHGGKDAGVVWLKRRSPPGMSAVNDAPPTMVVTLSIQSVLETIAGITRYVNPYR
ncbi:hypothetical protein BVD23_07495 [Salmonella enterica]|nr:hypothetical protein [Salmonella enterica]EBI7617573.1 hypothetical protein [Salmonella enterica]EBI8098734.1 hypothetical protein [Salmonella enterica]EBK3004070.1 hypothetical protein [Salmonella enterica]EBK9150633.1 hypothetical protein [Salmonella enterica]